MQAQVARVEDLVHGEVPLHVQFAVYLDLLAGGVLQGLAQLRLGGDEARALVFIPAEGAQKAGMDRVAFDGQGERVVASDEEQPVVVQLRPLLHGKAGRGVGGLDAARVRQGSAAVHEEVAGVEHLRVQLDCAARGRGDRPLVAEAVAADGQAAVLRNLDGAGVGRRAAQQVQRGLPARVA